MAVYPSDSSMAVLMAVYQVPEALLICSSEDTVPDIAAEV